MPLRIISVMWLFIWSTYMMWKIHDEKVLLIGMLLLAIIIELVLRKDK